MLSLAGRPLPLESPYVAVYIVLYHKHGDSFRLGRNIFMRQTIYLDKRRDVEVMRRLQRMQRVRRSPVVIRHEVFADLIGCSVSTIRRAINALVESGHIIRTHTPRPTRGGYLCVYHVRTDVIYRVASLVRRATRAIEQLTNTRKPAPQAVTRPPQSSASKDLKVNKDKYNRHKDGHHLSHLLLVAKTAGIDDKQRGFLRAAAMRYGVKRAWQALQMAFERGYPRPDLVKVTWGILKQQGC